MNYLLVFLIAAVAVGCVLIVKGGNRFDVDDYDDIKDNEQKARHCGECRHFKDEDINGDGWCEKYDAPTRCDKKCKEKENKGNLREFSSNYPN